jgi:hypothetical protein
MGLEAKGDHMRPPHTHPWPNLLSPPADWINAPRSALRIITLKDKSQASFFEMNT